MTDELTRRAEAHLAALRRHIKIVTKLRGNGPEPAGKDRLLIESERIIAAYKQRDAEHEQRGYILAMRLLQSSLALDDAERAALEHYLPKSMKA